MYKWIKEGVIEYHGVSDDVKIEINKVDCVILPSYYREGVPHSLLESAAVGRPIITTDSVGCRETVDDKISGYLCRPQDAVDLSEKKSQQFCRDLALRGVEEMFEALQHLKNWKPHRMTQVSEEFNKEEFLEEIVDALNYFFSLLIAAGCDHDELYRSYIKKDKIIRQRLLDGY